MTKATGRFEQLNNNVDGFLKVLSLNALSLRYYGKRLKIFFVTRKDPLPINI